MDIPLLYTQSDLVVGRGKVPAKQGMANCLLTYVCAGLLPEHSTSPLASSTSRRPSVTSRARRGRRHDQKVPIVIASEAWRSAFSRFSKKWELERRTVDCHAVLPNVLSLISLCLMAKRLLRNWCNCRFKPKAQPGCPAAQIA